MVTADIVRGMIYDKIAELKKLKLLLKSAKKVDRARKKVLDQGGPNERDDN